MPNFYQWIEGLAVSTLVHVVRPTNRTSGGVENDTEWDLSAFRIADLTRFNEPLGFAESMARILITCLVSNYPQAPSQRDRPQARRQEPFELPVAVPIVPAMPWEVMGHPH